MTDLTKSSLQNSVEEFGKELPWNHAIELPHGVWTADPNQVSHGKNLVKWKRIEPLIEQIGLGGKRVLDVACNEGYFSLQMSQAGAEEVLGFDISELRIKKARFVLQALGAVGISTKQMDIYSDNLAEIGRFDFTLCMGFLHRIPDVYGAIDALTAISDMILFEWKAYRGGQSHLPLMLYDGVKSLEQDPYSLAFFRPSVNYMITILRSKGFPFHFVVDDPKQGRAILVSSRKEHPIFKGRHVLGEKGKWSLFYKASRHYAANIRDILRGKIRV